LYTGFFLFSGWIIYREASWWRSMVWIVFLMMLGFFTGALYVFIALQTSGANWGQFWMGSHWNKERIGG
jgi:hypothetical protein